jgi:hypothetical protein
MPVYYDKFDIPDRICVLQNSASTLPAVLLTQNLPWSWMDESIVVNRHSFEMAVNW